MNPTDDDIDARILADLRVDADRVERLQRELDEALAARHRRIHEAADQVTGRRRRITNRRIAGAAGLSPQRVGELLDVPPPPVPQEEV